MDARVVVAAGRVRLDQLGDVPDNVTVQPGALTLGVPQLILPQGADQFANADAVSAAGAGLLLQMN